VRAVPLRVDPMPAPRGRLMRLGDRAVGRLLRLPPVTTDYTVTRGIPVPMRDGVELLADHYAPITSAPAGTLLVRCPYGRGLMLTALYALIYAARGFHVVVQNIRGTFGSGGVFDPGRHEVHDGVDTVAWLRRQPWFTGRFGTVGLSYLGFTQWALLVDPPPELAAAVITVGPHDMSAATWGTGTFALSDLLGWSDLVGHQEDGGRIKSHVRQLTATRRLRPALAGLPLGDAGRKLLGDGAPWYENWLEHPDVTAEYWLPTQLNAALQRAQIPVLLIGGWQDTFLRQTQHQYEQLRKRGVDAALTIGPWTHGQMTTSAAPTAARESLEWLTEHLSGTATRRRSSPVRVFVTGGQGWRELPDWPAQSVESVLYLQPGAALADHPPRPDAAPSRFTYDPADPTPTVGGPMIVLAAGYRNDSRLAERPDVLSFTGPPLTEQLEIVGTPYVELAHSTDNPHADLFVRVSEVDRKGRSRNVSDGYVRLSTNPTSPVQVELDATAHRFAAGSRIRLLIAGGSHPRFARNLGTDEPPITASRLRPCTHEIAHGAGGTSRVVLPVAR
jgi:uncharacterized protein